MMALVDKVAKPIIVTDRRLASSEATRKMCHATSACTTYSPVERLKKIDTVASQVGYELCKEVFLADGAQLPIHCLGPSGHQDSREYHIQSIED
jgi:hypothetical protein